MGRLGCSSLRASGSDVGDVLPHTWQKCGSKKATSPKPSEAALLHTERNKEHDNEATDEDHETQWR